MRAVFGIPLLLATSLGFSGPSPALDGAVSAERLAALDPTRLGRAICRGNSDRATLEERLRQAGTLAGSRFSGSAGMELYSGLAPTDIPAPELNGLAARYFAQGLALAYGFNHKAAIRSFRMAQEADPQCALCFWGEAMANGPNINAGMGSAENQAALAALARAEELVEGASPAARALIEAQALRYSTEAGNRAGLDAAYADAMATLAQRYPDSDDIAVLAAEAAMNTSPWDYWEKPDTPRPRIVGAISQIEKVVGRNPRHPQASHLYIHLMEAAQPKKAEAAADRLAAGAAPGALGHLVHMPSHIYYRIGRYADSMKANVAAVRADEAYLASVADDGLYRFGYYPHNVHFLLASAQMVGDMRRTTTETQRLATVLDADVARDIPWIQAIHAAPSFALAQYGTPDAILALTGKSSPLAYVEAMRHYARATAHAQRGDREAFGQELAAIERLAEAPEMVKMVDAGFPAPNLVKLAALVARARMEHWHGQPAAAIALYEQAEAIEATIPYTEPPFWYYPIAQSRGAALYAAGRYREAGDAFRKALFTAPNSGWALYGLAQSEQRLGHRLEAQAAEAALNRIWQGEKGWLKMSRL
ncbi:MAG TPA: hypothetical protein VFS87_02260 [Qipengyuania sp.]|nr:hypothetical protein [Qipengyuania sp.]